MNRGRVTCERADCAKWVGVRSSSTPPSRALGCSATAPCTRHPSFAAALQNRVAYRSPTRPCFRENDESMELRKQEIKPKQMQSHQQTGRSCRLCNGSPRRRETALVREDGFSLQQSVIRTRVELSECTIHEFPAVYVRGLASVMIPLVGTRKGFWFELEFRMQFAPAIRI